MVEEGDMKVHEEGEKKVHEEGKKRVVVGEEGSGRRKSRFSRRNRIVNGVFFLHFVVLREFRFSDICGNVFMIEDKMEDPRRCWVDHITAQSGLALCCFVVLERAHNLSRHCPC